MNKYSTVYVWNFLGSTKLYRLLRNLKTKHSAFMFLKFKRKCDESEEMNRGSKLASCYKQKAISMRTSDDFNECRGNRPYP